MTHAKKRWSYSTGERGRNRVRAFVHPKTGGLFLEFADGGTRKRMALGHRDRGAAKAKAEELAAALRRGGAPPLTAPTLVTLFDNYLREVTPQKGQSKQAHDHRAARLFLECFGSSRKAASLNRRDWDAFIRWRRSQGDRRRGRKSGAPLRNRVIEYDLRFLHAVLNWAVASGVLDRNPVQGLPWPREAAPRRPALRHDEYEALRAVAHAVHPLFALALVLAHETGHRIGAIRVLRWSDIHVRRGVVRWRAATDKMGVEHETLLTPEALAALERRRAEQPAIGDTWVLPAPNLPSEPCSRYQLQRWWRRAERLAGLAHEPGRSFHALRRKFATELKHVPLKDLCALGGWKSPQTVLTCYQTADDVTMREALATRRQLRAGT
jgi:integrase